MAQAKFWKLKLSIHQSTNQSMARYIQHTLNGVQTKK